MTGWAFTRRGIDNRGHVTACGSSSTTTATTSAETATSAARATAPATAPAATITIDNFTFNTPASVPPVRRSPSRTPIRRTLGDRGFRQHVQRRNRERGDRDVHRPVAAGDLSLPLLVSPDDARDTRGQIAGTLWGDRQDPDRSDRAAADHAGDCCTPRRWTQMPAPDSRQPVRESACRTDRLRLDPDHDHGALGAGVAMRTAHFDSWARQFLAVHARGHRAAPGLRPGRARLSARPRARGAVVRRRLSRRSIALRERIYPRRAGTR